MNLPEKKLNHHIYIYLKYKMVIAVNSKVDKLMSKHNINVTDNRYY